MLPLLAAADATLAHHRRPASLRWNRDYTGSEVKRLLDDKAECQPANLLILCQTGLEVKFNADIVKIHTGFVKFFPLMFGSSVQL